jgi:hypothetical protein
MTLTCPFFIHTDTITPPSNEGGRTIISTEEAEKNNLLDKDNAEHVEAYISAVPTEAVFGASYDLVNCLKTGCQSLFIAAVEYFSRGSKFEGLKELEIPYKRTKMDNSVIVYIIRLYIYLKESPEITKALLSIEATINPGATAIDFGVFRIPFYLGYLSQRMEYDAEKTPFRNAPSIPNLPVVYANNVQSKPATPVPLDVKLLFSCDVRKPGRYGFYGLGEGYGVHELSEENMLPLCYGDEIAGKRKRED